MKDFIIIVIIAVVVLAVIGGLGAATDKEQKNLPCSSYGNTEVQYIPAKCLKEYSL